MIDPRPYTYEYRKPRLNNPTYRSSNMYDSLYHLRFPSKTQFILAREKKTINQLKNLQANELSRYQQNPEKLEERYTQLSKGKINDRQHSVDTRQHYQQDRNSRNMSLNNDIIQRIDSKPQPSPFRQNNGIQSNLSNYGQSLMKSSQLNRFEVYDRQQKGFNIINLQPKQMSGILRAFPKLTLEDKLIQKGKYNRN